MRFTEFSWKYVVANKSNSRKISSNKQSLLKPKSKHSDEDLEIINKRTHVNSIIEAEEDEDSFVLRDEIEDKTLDKKVNIKYIYIIVYVYIYIYIYIYLIINLYLLLLYNCIIYNICQYDYRKKYIKLHLINLMLIKVEVLTDLNLQLYLHL